MKTVILLILDGWGYSASKLDNAIANARTPFINVISDNFPSLLLQASGRVVGLDWGDVGNSEVGHLTLGAGRTILQYPPRINHLIETGEFMRNPAFISAIKHCLKNQGSLHLFGLIGTGIVHSNFNHLLTLITLAEQQNVKKLYIHPMTDGKDSGLRQAPEILNNLQSHMSQMETGKIAGIVGRWYGMDRDNNWDRTKIAYDLMVSGTGQNSENLEKSIEAINDNYGKGIYDTKMPAIAIDPDGNIRDGDSVIFFNYREDSMRQISKAFVDPNFDKFPTAGFKNLYVATMTQYFEDENIKLNAAIPLPEIKNGLAEILSEHGKKQLHVAETEKFAHTTYFFNGLINKPYELEKDFLIESFKNQVENPQMRADEIATAVVDGINSGDYDFIVANIANADILAHAGAFQETIRGVEFADSAIGRIYKTAMDRDAVLIITADHGNAEAMIYKVTGDIETKHNSNPVPFYLIGREYIINPGTAEKEVVRSNITGMITDVAPTVLDIMGIQKPAEMSGDSLLSKLTNHNQQPIT